MSSPAASRANKPIEATQQTTSSAVSTEPRSFFARLGLTRQPRSQASSASATMRQASGSTALGQALTGTTQYLIPQLQQNLFDAALTTLTNFPDISAFGNGELDISLTVTTLNTKAKELTAEKRINTLDLNGLEAAKTQIQQLQDCISQMQQIIYRSGDENLSENCKKSMASAGDILVIEQPLRKTSESLEKSAAEIQKKIDAAEAKTSVATTANLQQAASAAAIPSRDMQSEAKLTILNMMIDCCTNNNYSMAIKLLGKYIPMPGIANISFNRTCKETRALFDALIKSATGMDCNSDEYQQLMQFLQQAIERSASFFGQKHNPDTINGRSATEEFQAVLTICKNRAATGLDGLLQAVSKMQRSLPGSSIDETKKNNLLAFFELSETEEQEASTSAAAEQAPPVNRTIKPARLAAAEGASTSTATTAQQNYSALIEELGLGGWLMN